MGPLQAVIPTFDATGDFTIYYEAPGADAGPDVLPPLTITVASQGGGSQVAMEKYGSTFTYSIDGYEGMALATFRIESPGTYTLTATSPIPPGLAQLAVGRSLGSTFVQTLLPILFLLATLLAASLLAIVTAIRRRNARRA